jgi:hypothetical protein
MTLLYDNRAASDRFARQTDVFGGWDDTETGPNTVCVRRQLQKSEPFLGIGGQPTHSHRVR